MLDEFDEIEYDPVYEISDYKGSYPIIQLNKVRRFIINGLKRDINSTIEFEIKRKCAIFTKDIINYKLLDKKPEEFDEQKTFHIDQQQNPFLHKTLNIDEEDLIISTQENNTIEQNKSESELSIPESSFNPPDPFYKKNLTTVDKEIQSLNKCLLLQHGCDKWCYRNLPSKDEISESEKQNLIYICDFCHFDTEDETIIKEHLSEKEHGSASEFLREAKSSDQTSNGSASKVLSYDEYFKSAFDSKRKITFITKRYSVKNKILDEFNRYEVLCPKCHCHFGHEILAACLHFKSSHSATLTDEIYSIGELIRTDSFEIKKVHSCITCCVQFKKLSDLAQHLESSHHFPGSQKNETNIFLCPFDNCGYKSSKFFSFKNHTIQHPFFNNPNVGKFNGIKVKVGIYSSPKAYFHIPTTIEKTKTDKNDELEAVIKE